MVTASSFSRVSLMAVKRASTELSAAVLDSETWVGTWDEMSDFFNRLPLGIAVGDGLRANGAELPNRATTMTAAQRSLRSV